MNMTMRALRRAALALTLAGIAAVAVRLKGGVDPPSQSGGWRELSRSDLR